MKLTVGKENMSILTAVYYALVKLYQRVCQFTSFIVQRVRTILRFIRTSVFLSRIWSVGFFSGLCLEKMKKALFDDRQGRKQATKAADLLRLTIFFLSSLYFPFFKDPDAACFTGSKSFAGFIPASSERSLYTRPSSNLV